MLAGSGIDEIYAQINSSGTTSYLRDGLNSTVAVTNGSAATTENYSYSPYGDSVGTGTSSTPLQYTGRENDGATGLYYYRARYYSPQLGRFIAEDPIGIGGGTNYYAYAMGNPVSFRDPLGLYDVTVTAGFSLPVTPGATIGLSRSWSLENYSENPNFNWKDQGLVVQGEVGALIDGGYQLGITDISNSGGRCEGASFNFGLGKYLGISVTLRSSQDQSLWVINPLRCIDGFSVGLGLGLALPVTVSVPVVHTEY